MRILSKYIAKFSRFNVSCSLGRIKRNRVPKICRVESKVKRRLKDADLRTLRDENVPINDSIPTNSQFMKGTESRP